jgi:hypothetical protein
LPKSRWVSLTQSERKKLARLIMKILLPIFGGLAVLGIFMLILLQ